MNNNLKLIENELVPVYETSTGEKVVYGSELHIALQVKSPYREWYRRRFEDCEAVENEDYQGVEISTPSGQNRKEHIIKLDIAKEMAMLERNEKGKQVRRYFISIEKKYKEAIGTKINQKTVTFKEQVECLAIVSDMLKANEASKIYMIGQLYKANNIKCDFLPDYEYNGNRELKSATELLKRYGFELSVRNFNILLRENGFLEEKTRRSTNKKGARKYNALTEKGLEYGENAISPHCQRETQPMYYADSFKELYNKVVKNTEVA